MRSPRLRNAMRLLASTAALALVVACGGNGEGDLLGPGDLSSFSATVTGGSAGSYSGFSSVVPSSGLFSIGMSTGDGKFALGFSRTGTRPTTGTYELGTNAQTGFTAALRINTDQVIYTSSSGTLTITSSSSTEIKGTFSFTGTVTAGASTSTNVSGSFSAPCPVGC